MKNYVLIGDVHSQYDKLSNAIDFIENNIEKYYIIFLGDLFDSRNDYSNSLGVYEKVKSILDSDLGIALRSNHQDKHIRYIKGHSVYVNNGLEKTIEDFKTINSNEILNFLESFPYGIVFKDSTGLEYRCAHAYFSSKIYVPKKYSDEYLIYDVSKSTKHKFLYGILSSGSRVEWWNNESNLDWIRVSGHYHKVHIDLENTKSIVLDAECGDDGGQLCIFDINSKKLSYF